MTRTKKSTSAASTPSINLGINAEDMLGMLDNTISDFPVTARDLKPYTYPPAADLRRERVRSVCLGSFIPWDVRKQVDLIKSELGWQGDEVEGVPPEYDYEKIECFMQGVRDYIKYLKRGFGRTAHLASIDIRNGRMTREEGERLVSEYDGKRPASLDLFLDYLGIDERQFMELVGEHVVDPHEPLDYDWAQAHKMDQKPWDYDQVDTHRRGTRFTEKAGLSHNLAERGAGFNVRTQHLSDIHDRYRR